MRVEIRDPSVFAALSHVDVRRYLQAAGWQDHGVFQDKATIHTHADATGREWEVLLPSREDLGDYKARMAEAVRYVARVENRSELDVLGDLENAGKDLIRVRAPQAEADGSIPLGRGVALHEASHALLLAAACAVVRPRLVHRAGRMPQVIDDYLETVRLGQTERGSYVVTLLSPVDPALRHGGQGLLPIADSEPFSRRVTLRLVEGLRTLQQAVNRIALGADLDVFERAVGQGISVNLCEAVTRLAQVGGGVEIGVSWARVRPAAQGNVRLGFTGENARILEEAARELRSREPDYDRALTGWVVNLDKRDPRDFAGTATLLLTLDERLCRVRVRFEQTDFERVQTAFRERRPIAVNGDLYRLGSRYELRNAHELSVLDDTGLEANATEDRAMDGNE